DLPDARGFVGFFGRDLRHLRRPEGDRGRLFRLPHLAAGDRSGLGLPYEPVTGEDTAGFLRQERRGRLVANLSLAVITLAVISLAVICLPLAPPSALAHPARGGTLAGFTRLRSARGRAKPGRHKSLRLVLGAGAHPQAAVVKEQVVAGKHQPLAAGELAFPG